MAWKCQMCSESLWWLISIRWDNVRASVAACTDLEIWRREADTKFDVEDLKIMEREGQQHQNIQKHTNRKLCGMNDLEMVEREGGRANSGGRKQLTVEEVGCMCCCWSYLQLRWSWSCPQVNWPSVLKVHWLALLACLHRPVSRGWSAMEGSPGRLSRSQCILRYFIPACKSIMVAEGIA